MKTQHSNNQNADVDQLNNEHDQNYIKLRSPPKPCVKRFLNASDTFISLFIISPLAVTFWHGTWVFMDHNQIYFPPWTTTIFGAVLHTIIAISREHFYARYEYSKVTNKTLTAYVARSALTKIHAYIFGIACIMHWRGCWAILDIYYGNAFWPALAMTVICFAGLVCFKSLRNILAPPVVILTDTKQFAFGFPMRFRIQGTQEPGLFILDCIFSVLVIGTLVVIVWRGMWVLCDMLIYPEDKLIAGWAGLAVGYGIVAITFALQPLMRWTCDRLTGFFRVAVADIFLFFSFIGTVNVWRGVWGLLDVYLLPENKLLGDVLSHCLGFLLLALLNCSNSVLVRGVYIDAEEPAGQCVIFPIYYVRLFFQKERTKKQRRLLDALENSELQNNKSLLSEKSAKPPIKNNNANSIKSIELTGILDNVGNVDEIIRTNGERIVRKSSE